MNKAWSGERGRTNENTVRGQMVCKINFDLTCNEFKKKINSTEKYKYYLTNYKCKCSKCSLCK